MNKSQRGFTLIEMMIVVIIIGIIAAFAFPTYQNSINRTYRNDAQAALLSLAAAYERRYTENNSYCDVAMANANGAVVANCGDGATNDTGNPTFFSQYVPIDSAPADAIYELSISAAAPGSFTLTAEAIDPGRMADDECGDFTYNSFGQKDLVGQDAGITAADCW